MPDDTPSHPGAKTTTATAPCSSSTAYKAAATQLRGWRTCFLGNGQKSLVLPPPPHWMPDNTSSPTASASLQAACAHRQTATAATSPSPSCTAASAGSRTKAACATGDDLLPL